MLPTPAQITIDGLPAHPLIVHAVVILLPLAAFGGLVIAARSTWRRRFGVVVLLLTAAGVGAVPVATYTGEQLRDAQFVDPLIEEHEDIATGVLPFALAFGIAVVLLMIAGRLADRERDAATAASTPASSAAASAEGAEPVRPPRTWRRLALVAAALVAFTAVAATVQVVRAGHSGSTAVWEGIIPS